MWFLSISKYNAYLEVLMGKYLSNGIGLYSNVDDKISVCCLSMMLNPLVSRNVSVTIYVSQITFPPTGSWIFFLKILHFSPKTNSFCLYTQIVSKPPPTPPHPLVSRNISVSIYVSQYFIFKNYFIPHFTTKYIFKIISPQY